MTTCPVHPSTPRTRLGCCQCHGLELAAKDKLARPNWDRARKLALSEFDEDAPVHLDNELQQEIAMTIDSVRRETVSTWGRHKNQVAAGLLTGV